MDMADENLGAQSEKKRRNVALRKKAVDALGGCCKTCGNLDYRCLQIDHINGNGERDRNNFSAHTRYSWIVENQEDAKNFYQILCANCNWIKRHENNEHRGSPKNKDAYCPVIIKKVKIKIVKEKVKMAPGIRNRGFLDPKQCWKDWNVHIGSLKGIQDKFLQEGKINHKTGNPPTKSGIEKAAFAWAIDPANQNEARHDLEFAWSKEGIILDDEAWKRFLVDAAGLVYHQRPAKFHRFLVQNGLLEYADVESVYAS
jgi:hypothetical protein